MVVNVIGVEKKRTKKMIDEFFKYKDPASGFITRHKDLFNKTLTHAIPDTTQRWEKTREVLGPDWVWYDDSNRIIEYTYDKYGFRNWNDPDELEEDNYILCTGQSAFEGTGLPIEETIPYKIEQYTGIKTYMVACPVIDTQTVYYNTITALDVLPKPKHIVYMPTHPDTKVMTFEIEEGKYFNCFTFFGKNREHICNTYGIDEEYLINSVQMTEQAINSGYMLNKFYECNSLIDKLPVDTSIIKFTDDGEGDLYDKIDIEPRTVGNERFFNGPNRIIMELFPTKTEFQDLLRAHINLSTPFDRLPLEWINTRARDVLHTGPIHHEKLANAIKTIIIED